MPLRAMFIVTAAAQLLIYPAAPCCLLGCSRLAWKLAETMPAADSADVGKK
jgi:hypothetical protein